MKKTSLLSSITLILLSSCSSGIPYDTFIYTSFIENKSSIEEKPELVEPIEPSLDLKNFLLSEFTTKNIFFENYKSDVYSVKEQKMKHLDIIINFFEEIISHSTFYNQLYIHDFAGPNWGFELHFSQEDVETLYYKNFNFFTVGWIYNRYSFYGDYTLIYSKGIPENIKPGTTIKIFNGRSTYNLYGVNGIIDANIFYSAFDKLWPLYNYIIKNYPIFNFGH